MKRCICIIRLQSVQTVNYLTLNSKLLIKLQVAPLVYFDVDYLQGLVYTAHRPTSLQIGLEIMTETPKYEFGDKDLATEWLENNLYELKAYGQTMCIKCGIVIIGSRVNFKYLRLHLTWCPCRKNRTEWVPTLVEEEKEVKNVFG